MEIHQRENEDERVQFIQISLRLLSKTRVGLSAKSENRSRRSYPCIELIRAVLRMTKKKIKLNQATGAAGEIKSVLQV